MGRFFRFSDRDLDALMAGRTPAGRGELDDLAAFLRDAAVVFEQAPDEGIESRHLAAIVQSAQLLAEDGPATEPTATGEPAQAPRRKFMSRKLLVPLAAGLLLALSAFGGVAYAGALPGPIQGGVADVVDNLGVSLPGAEDDNDNGAQNNKDDGPVDDRSEGPVADVDEGAKADKDDGPVANLDEGAKEDKDDGAVDDGAKADKDDGPVANVDEGAKDDVDDGAKDDKDDGAVEDRDGGARDDVQQGPQNDVDDGPQRESDESDQDDGPSSDGDHGSQGEGE